ncbi:alanine racemase [Helicobacter sp. MIT 14-3879]|uniref:alanine racemase n=1 Tax=Helicobacter sp. MIT 14-3879 TaxID=2040649 RepID=UPI000E1EE6CD|nr:alanine racemase [Helicobacter sp. MIT 14-3879]RDU65102.1 alanine racemase [Helicobacter sp. MIT 14-3879]
MSYNKLKRYCWAEINIANFTNNLHIIKNKLNKNTKILCVVKANGYGHGAIKLAKAALDFGVYQLGVATLEEAMELRENYKNARILILGYTPPNLAKEVIKNDIELCVYHKEVAIELSKEAKKQNKVANIHIKLDTGMGRIGYTWNKKNLDEILYITKLDSINIKGVFTHFSSADELNCQYTKKQYKIYNKFIEFLNNNRVNNFIKHCSNSAGIITYPNAIEDMARIGIIAYGLKPSLDINIEGLKAVMSLKAKIVHIKTLPKNCSISYGRTYTTNKKAKIATLPLGYADGYMRLLSNKAEVLVKSKRAKVVGNICMDQCTIDISNIDNVKIDDEVTLFGYDKFNNELSVDELAKHVGSINYEIICAISNRVPRIYIDK